MKVELKNDRTVTVLTPTYNRAPQLHDLWRSLCAQTCHDFCWLIVDDGSDEEIVIADFMEQKKK